LFCRHMVQVCGCGWSIAGGVPVPLCALLLCGAYVVSTSLFTSLYFQSAANGCSRRTLAPPILVSLFCCLCHMFWFTILTSVVSLPSVHNNTATPKLRQLVSGGFPPWWPRFDPRSGHMGFV
jgi:protein-S-isoprenylcysteine O-methyltransferase Ste14